MGLTEALVVKSNQIKWFYKSYVIFMLKDGNLGIVAHARMNIGLFREKIQFVTAFDLITCL